MLYFGVIRSSNSEGPTFVVPPTQNDLVCIDPNEPPLIRVAPVLDLMLYEP